MTRRLAVAFLSFLLLPAASLPLAGTAGSPGFPVLTGEYLGQEPPGAEPRLFAPGIVSTGLYTRDVAMTPDGKEIYFCVMIGGYSSILETKLEKGRWTEPRISSFSANPNDQEIEPHISPDGKQFFFLSNRPPDGSEIPPDQAGRWQHQDLWVMDRTDSGWSQPRNLGPPVNTEDAEYFPSVTRDGTLYFTRSKGGARDSYIYRSRLVDGKYAEPEKLGPEVNSTGSQFNAFIAPDESYLIVSTAGREDSLGGSDYYVVFRNKDDSWTGPVNMGEAVNSPRGAEFSPYVSPDGKYFFFMATRPASPGGTPAALTLEFLRGLHAKPGNANPAIYWMEAGFIRGLRPDGSG